jgi:hypothetical protein
VDLSLTRIVARSHQPAECFVSLDDVFAFGSETNARYGSTRSHGSKRALPGARRLGSYSRGRLPPQRQRLDTGGAQPHQLTETTVSLRERWPFTNFAIKLGARRFCPRGPRHLRGGWDRWRSRNRRLIACANPYRTQSMLPDLGLPWGLTERRWTVYSQKSCASFILPSYPHYGQRRTSNRISILRRRHSSRYRHGCVCGRAGLEAESIRCRVR